MSNYQLKIHVEKPGTIYKDPDSGAISSSAQGHVWYEVIEPSGTSVVRAGFGPLDPKNTMASVRGTVLRADDASYAGDPYFTASYNISEKQAQILKDYAIQPTNYGFNLTYWAVSNSCVDYVWKALNIIGMNPSNYEGELLPIDNIARFSALSNDRVKLEKISNTIGNSFVSGFSSTKTSIDGVNWSSSMYEFEDITSANNADQAAWEGFANGKLSESDFLNIVNASTNYLLNKNTTSYTTSIFDMDVPIGAFYESKSVGTDVALSISKKTFRILNSANQSVTAAQLEASDVNKDGNLTGSELNGFNAWVDSNEDGIGQSSELMTLFSALANVGLSSVRSTDYAFYTAGNANFKTVVQNTVSAPVNSLVAPVVPIALANNYATLRANDNRFVINSYLWINWSVNQVKISSDQKNLIGTNGNDNFNINYYARYNGIYFNLDLIQNFYAGGGNDCMGGSARNDNLFGGLGDDSLWGLEGVDQLYGEEGNDQLQGGDGNDALDGGIGNDLLFGQVGNDVMNGGDGNDVLVGFTGSNENKQNLASGESDDDTMFGGNGNDEMYGGLGNDYIDGGADNDIAFGGDGNDSLYGGTNDDDLVGGSGNDILDGGVGADKLFGGVGDDQMWGGDGSDIMIGFMASNEKKQSLEGGETDDDLMYGGNGDDLMIGGVGDDQIWGGVGNDELQGGNGNDALYGEDGIDRLFGNAGNDILYGGDGDDVLIGGTASNEAALAAGISDNNFLYGGAGNDIIVGGIGNDYIDGGAGADDMEGGKGDDTYIINSVNDVILEQVGEGYDIVLSSSNYILNANIEELRLVEGVNIHGTGNSLNNRIIGNSQDNILDGVTGEDVMIGGRGNDTYYVDNVGDQVVELSSEGIDVVNSNISYALGANVENLTLLDFAKPEKGIADGVNILVYGYPKAYELDYMQGNAVAGYKGTCALTAIANLGTQANQALSEAQVVKTAIQNNWCVNYSFVSDYQRGGSNYKQQQELLTAYGIRNGIIKGYNEQNIANLIKGGRGVIIAMNAGKLWSDDAYLTGGGVNHVITVTGVACDAISGEINGFYIADSGRSLVSDMTRYISIADFRMAANVANAYAIYTIDPIKLWKESINATGNELNNVITGNRGDNVLKGGLGNDTLNGQAGNDTYVFNLGDGQDTVLDNDSTIGNGDRIIFGNGIRTSDIRAYRNGKDLVLSGVANNVTVKDWYLDDAHKVEQIEFSDGTVWDIESLQKMTNVAPTGTVWINGLAIQSQLLTARNTLVDSDGIGVMAYQWQISSDGAAWIDLNGATKSTYALTQAEVSKRLRVVISYRDGCGKKEVVVSESTTNIINVNDAPTGSISIVGSLIQNQTLTLINGLSDVDGLGILRYQWQSSIDGVIWNNITAATLDTFRLTANQINKKIRVVASYLDGYGKMEVVMSAPTEGMVKANNAPTGGVKVEGLAQEYQILTASNTLVDGDGLGVISYQWQSSIDGIIWIDIVGSVANTFSLGKGLIGKKVRVVSSYIDGNGTKESVASLETLVVTQQFTRFLIEGTDGNDVITSNGRNENNTYIGGKGNDTITDTGGGNDTYIFNRGDGMDIIEDEGSGTSVDKIMLKGISQAETVLGRSNNNLIIGLGQGDQITVKKFFDSMGWNQIESIQFDDGSVLSLEQLKAAPIRGTEGNDTLTSTASNESNAYIGGKGNDTITDTGGGNDTYIFNRGDGADIIEDGGFGASVDKIMLKGISQGETVIGRSNNNLIIDLGQGDQITVKKFFDSMGRNQIESVQFDDGSVLSLEQLKAAPIRGTEGNDTLTSTAWNENNTYIGGKGNDTITDTGGGNDTYIFSRGDGVDTISDKNPRLLTDADVLHFQGINQTNLWFKKIGNDLQITVMGSIDQVMIKNWYASMSSYANQVEQIRTAEGFTLYNSDVENFVQAMAAFAPPDPNQTSWTSGQTSNNGKVLLTVTH